MNKKIRQFMTLSCSPSRGFTLVELIVVIAILGILAGIAIPVYTNYTKRANEASDRQLIGAVNTAFAAACLENGFDHTKVESAKLVFETRDGKLYIKGLSDVKYGDRDTSAVDDSFVKFFGDNKDTPLKYFTADDIGYSGPAPISPAGVFVAEKKTQTDGILKANWNWGDTSAATEAYFNSNWKNMGVDGLTKTVDHLTNALKVYGNMRNVLAEAEDFKQELKDKFGIDFEDADNATLANATVFYVAKRLANADATDLQTALKKDRMATMEASEDGDSDVVINTNLDNYLKTIGIDDSVNHREYQLVTATLKYALATAYVNSENGNVVLDPNTGETLKERVEKTSLDDYASVISLYNEVQKQRGYSSYLSATATGANADIDAFSKILSVLNGNTDAFVDISGSGMFSSDEVQAAINEILSTSGGGE